MNWQTDYARVSIRVKEILTDVKIPLTTSDLLSYFPKSDWKLVGKALYYLRRHDLVDWCERGKPVTFMGRRGYHWIWRAKN